MKQKIKKVLQTIRESGNALEREKLEMMQLTRLEAKEKYKQILEKE